jgi:hypothetical protein
MKRLGRTTELVVYPGQLYGISKPSYVKDRWSGTCRGTAGS